jgi:nitrous oxidase accessory protein NosD
VVADRTLSKGVDPVTTTACTDPSVPALTVNANLDLGGQTIRCAGALDGIVIAANAVTVKKGTVRDCAFGIYSAATSGSTISDMRLISNRFGLVIDGGTLNTIMSNVSIGDRISSLDGFAINANGNSLIQNRCEDHVNDGIRVIGNDNILTLNYCLTNIGNGIYVEGERNDLNHNQGRTNGQHGVFVKSPTGAQTNFPLSDQRNYGNGNGLDAGFKNCEIDGNTLAKKYC